MQKIKGSIMGAILGDAFALPYEFSTPSTNQDKHIEKRAQEESHWGYSDDSVMLISLLESLCKLKKFNEKHFLYQMYKNYEPARGFGKGMKRAFLHIERGGSWTEARYTSWKTGSKGNGAAVRVVPLACYYHDIPDSLFFSWIEQSAEVTHANYEAVTATKIQAYIIKTLLKSVQSDFDSEQLLKSIKKLDFLEDGIFLDKLHFIQDNYCREVLDRDEVINTLGTGVLAVESQLTALFCFLRYLHNYEQAVIYGAKLGGDTDTICAMIGALSGAFLGVKKIPNHWLENLESDHKGSGYIRTLLSDLF